MLLELHGVCCSCLFLLMSWAFETPETWQPVWQPGVTAAFAEQRVCVCVLWFIRHKRVRLPVVLCACACEAFRCDATGSHYACHCLCVCVCSFVLQHEPYSFLVCRLFPAVISLSDGSQLAATMYRVQQYARGRSCTRRVICN